MIVWGHVACGHYNFASPPIYPKQLGVAFFIFAMGFSLARESKPAGRVVFNRLFDIYFFGIAIAVLISFIMLLVSGDLNESNYLPFFGGSNVLFNSFPANPTTWYIGTYLHILLLWAFFLRRIRVRPWMIAGSLMIETAIRALLIREAGGFVAYMLFTNWLTVLLLGTLFGQKPDAERRRSYGYLWLALLIGLAFAWRPLTAFIPFQNAFPFRLIADSSVWPQTLAASALVSFVYLSFTLLLFLASRTAPAPSWARFFARNTLIVFIAHMPVYFALDPVLEKAGFPYAAQGAIHMTTGLLLLALLSEWILRAVNPRKCRERLVLRLQSRSPFSFLTRRNEIY